MTADQIAAYQQNGYVKLKEVFSLALLATYGAQIARVVQERNTQHLLLAERGTYAKAFLQITNLGNTMPKSKNL